MLEIQALLDTTQLNIQVALNAFEGNFFACVADREIHLAKTTRADSAFNGVALQWF
jgi:hypothetical protein